MVRAVRNFSMVVCCVVVLGLVAGCGNRTEVCDEARTAFQGLAAEVRTAPASEAAKWKQIVDSFAGRLDALARKSDDAELKTTLEKAAKDARAAAAGAGTGDVVKLQRFITEQPSRVGAACD